MVAAWLCTCSALNGLEHLAPLHNRQSNARACRHSVLNTSLCFCLGGVCLSGVCVTIVRVQPPQHASTTHKRPHRSRRDQHLGVALQRQQQASHR
jgi:hypothetical protein